MKNLFKIKNILFAIMLIILTGFLQSVIKLGFWVKLYQTTPVGFPSDPGGFTGCMQVITDQFRGWPFSLSHIYGTDSCSVGVFLSIFGLVLNFVIFLAISKLIFRNKKA